MRWSTINIFTYLKLRFDLLHPTYILGAFFPLESALSSVICFFPCNVLNRGGVQCYILNICLTVWWLYHTIWALLTTSVFSAMLSSNIDTAFYAQKYSYFKYSPTQNALGSDRVYFLSSALSSCGECDVNYLWHSLHKSSDGADDTTAQQLINWLQLLTCMALIPYLLWKLVLFCWIRSWSILPSCCTSGKRAGLKAGKASSHLFLQGFNPLENHHSAVEKCYMGNK